MATDYSADEDYVVAGDRLASSGHMVAAREVQKVYPADSHSLIAIAGAAGPAIELARLLRVELEHYEKIEGEALELEGKANKLSQMVRANLPAAMQGLVVVPHGLRGEGAQEAGDLHEEPIEDIIAVTLLELLGAQDLHGEKAHLAPPLQVIG